MGRSCNACIPETSQLSSVSMLSALLANSAIESKQVPDGEVPVALLLYKVEKCWYCAKMQNDTKTDERLNLYNSLKRLVLVACLATVAFITMSSFVLSRDMTSPSLVSLSTTIGRADKELGVALYSLLHQSVTTAIYVYVPIDEEKEFALFMKSNPKSLLHDSRVTLIPSFDFGPSTKFIPVIALLKKQGGNGRVVICDDDHYYSASTVETLVSHHTTNPSNAYGFRGWRIRSDYQWGVSPEEYDFHVHEGVKLNAPYQVGVLTANQCYVIDASWFTDSALVDYSTAPRGAAFVDDIWLNGHLAKLGVKRFIVPISDASLDIAETKTLDDKMRSKRVSRHAANSATLAWFKEEFSREAIPYVFGGASEQPEKRAWIAREIVKPVREWLMRGWISHAL